MTVWTTRQKLETVFMSDAIALMNDSVTTMDFGTTEAATVWTGRRY